ncbi:hypothetical protein BGZ49_002699 [Haplosporangium sp. Z 27]|nr:hypothetical protein BGZ49_002699 [Haplosporangium sp. Z 27]
MDFEANDTASSFSPSPSPAPSTSSTQTIQPSEPSKKRKPYSKKDGSTPASKAKSSNKGERMTFELDDVLRKYSPEQFKTCQAYDVGGVNILNKKPVDSKTALDKIKRRRETHNRVERRRRDCINQLIEELTNLLPKEDDDSQTKCHRVNILRTAVAHIQNLTEKNEDLTRQLAALQGDKSMSPPTIVTTPAAPTINYTNEDDNPHFHQHTYKSEPTQSPPYTSHAPRSPLSPRSPGFSPASSPLLQGQQGHEQAIGLSSHLTPYSTSRDSARSPSPSLPSLNEMSVALHSIPMIIEPSESPTASNSGAAGSHAKRLNRQTLPRLQLVPPPFHHHQRSGNNHNGAPSSPSYYGQDSLTSPASTYSGYSSTSGPWSSTSSLGPFSANSSTGGPMSSYGGTSPRSPGYSPYGPPSPYSLYGPPSHASPTSPSYSHPPPPSTSARRSNEWDSERGEYRSDYNHYPPSSNNY